MKIACEIIRDLLPLYAEDMVSEKSKEAVEEHLEECEDCKAFYQRMTAPEPSVQFDVEEAKSFQSFVKKKKWSFGCKVALLSVALVMFLVLLRGALLGGAIGLLVQDMVSAKVEVDTDASRYSQYMGEQAGENYRSKCGMEERIFPKEIRADMSVEDYKMVYYNPWDPQYLSYLVVEYDAETYRQECARLASYSVGDYVGNYGVTGFDGQYQLLAMDADPYYGFVYALTDGESKIIYVEIIFCNYFMDLDYEEYIDKSYLPLGFDASSGNPYRKKMLATVTKVKRQIMVTV